MSFETVGMSSRGRMASPANKMTQMSLPISIPKSNNANFAAIDKTNVAKYERPFSNCGLIDVNDPSALSRMSSSQASKYDTLWAYAVPVDGKSKSEDNPRTVNAKKNATISTSIRETSDIKNKSLAAKIADYEAKYGPIKGVAKSSDSMSSRASSTLKKNVANTMQRLDSELKTEEDISSVNMQSTMQQMTRSDMQDMMRDLRLDMQKIKSELASQFAKQDKAVNDKLNPFNEGLNRLVERQDKLSKDLKQMNNVQTVNEDCNKQNMDFLRSTMPARVVAT